MSANKFHDRDFWLTENRKYSEPYFRLEKCARIVNALSKGFPCDLLDIGCGPATLEGLLDKNIRYYGIDIAICKPAVNLIESDFSRNEIKFRDKSFDILVAAGVFEYMGRFQNKKLLEISNILNPDGKFVVTYSNFHHFRHSTKAMRLINKSLYNNILPLKDFAKNLELFFHVEKWFPSSHNRAVSEPNRKWLKTIQMPLEMKIPIISRSLAVNYFFICSSKNK